jgi:uncharacterized protein YecE (DUF72 family)
LYPAALPARQWLEAYSGAFDTVEANGTFYRLPPRATFASWRLRTPPDFTMAIKASRFLTHLKRLRDPGPPLARLFTRATALGPRLGPILYQLPPQLRCDVDRLRTFLAALPRRNADVPSRRRQASPAPRVAPFRHVMEFRHPSWYVDDVYGLLTRHRVALCLHDKTGSSIVDPPIGPFVYVRFHGPSGHYSGSYPSAALAAWADRMRGWAGGGRDVYAYFNNDIGGAAVGNARTLIELVAAA